MYSLLSQRGWLPDACHRRQAESPIIVHVIRDPSGPFVGQLRRATNKFDITKPRLNNGKGIMIATNEGDSFAQLLEQLTEAQPEVLLLDSEADIPGGKAVRSQLGQPSVVCGGHPAYIPAWVPNEKREAAEMYLRFLTHSCDEK